MEELDRTSACSLQVVGGSLTHVATSLTKTEGFPSPGPRKVVALPPGVLPRLPTTQPIEWARQWVSVGLLW
jgi:hypothetical protein